MCYNKAIARAGGHETAESGSHGTKPKRHRHHEQTKGRPTNAHERKGDTVTQTEAQKRAQKNYRKKLKRWDTDLYHQEFEAVEKKRQEDGLTRREVLLKYAASHHDTDKGRSATRRRGNAPFQI